MAGHDTQHGHLQQGAGAEWITALTVKYILR